MILQDQWNTPFLCSRFLRPFINDLTTVHEGCPLASIWFLRHYYVFLLAGTIGPLFSTGRHLLAARANSSNCNCVTECPSVVSLRFLIKQIRETDYRRRFVNEISQISICNVYLISYNYSPFFFQYSSTSDKYTYLIFFYTYSSFN